MTTGGWRPGRITPHQVGGAPTAASLAEHLGGLDVAAVLARAKAVLCAGFAVTPAELGLIIDAALPRRMAYVPGYLRRDRIGPGLYGAPTWPSGRVIPAHQVLSDAARWPALLLLYCASPDAMVATRLVDAAAWLAGLDAEVRAAFAVGVRYEHHCRAWPAAFETTDRARVDAHLAAAGATWQWCDDGLRVRHHRPAVVRHPATGVEVWFNQSDLWHPHQVAFADGAPIPDEYVRQIRRLAEARAVELVLGAGDVLLLDNVLLAHGWRAQSARRHTVMAMAV